MSANTKPDIRELCADELELVGGGLVDILTRTVNAYDWGFRVAADYWFNAEGGAFFHGSSAAQQAYINN